METIITNLDVKGDIAPTQVSYQFNSYCRFAGHVLAAGAGGLMRLGCNDFNGADIVAYLETFANELGYDGNKRLRFLYLLVETDGVLKITCKADNVVIRTLTVTPDNTGQQLIKVPVGSKAGGASWSFRIENVDGCWFAIKSLSALSIYLSRGRKARRV